MESACGGCAEVIQLNKYSEKNWFVLHARASLINIPKDHINKREWKKHRDQFIIKYKQYISALRNSGGGIVFVHIQDLDPTDWCLDHFHEFVDDRLNLLIEDGSLFVNTYRKDWFSDESENKGIIVTIVSPSESVVTVSYNTKLPLDGSIVDPLCATITELLQHRERIKESKPTIRGLDSIKLRESRNIQVKTIFANSDKFDDIDAVINNIWKDLKLGFYVSAFTKLDSGGSFYVGIEEKPKPYGTYISKCLNITGFECKFSRETFINRLKQKVQGETLILADTDIVVKKDLIDAVFHQMDDKHNTYVLEVAVAAVQGLVFYDRNGPEAYELGVNGDITRIDPMSWLRRILKHLISPS